MNTGKDQGDRKGTEKWLISPFFSPHHFCFSRLPFISGNRISPYKSGHPKEPFSAILSSRLHRADGAKADQYRKYPAASGSHRSAYLHFLIGRNDLRCKKISSRFKQRFSANKSFGKCFTVYIFYHKAKQQSEPPGRNRRYGLMRR